MALKSIMLILLAIVVLVLPGMLYNNLNSNGLAVSQTQTLSCSTDPQTPTCQISGNVGCQASSAYCNLSGSSISFLSGSSPFTQLIQGNIFGFFSNLNGPGYTGPGAQNSVFGQHGPFDVSQGGKFYTANCIGQRGVGHGGSQKFWTFSVCQQTYSDNRNISTSADYVSWQPWNTQQSGVSTPFTALKSSAATNGTFNHSCTYMGQINYTALANGPGYTYFGCSVSKPNHALVITDAQWDYLVAMPVSSGVMPAGVSHQFLFVQPENWATPQCSGNGTPQGSPYASSGCENFASNFQGVLIPGTAVTFTPGVGAAFIGIFAGIALFVLGTGLSFGFGGGLSAGSNEQGSKLAQVLGLSLLVWTPLYSEFGTWFTTGLLPYGLDGPTGIMSLLLTGMFFFGVIWRSWSRD